MVALTIGMAIYKDFDGAYFTIQALRMYQDMTDTELVVVDNFGDDHIRDFVQGWAQGQVHPGDGCGRDGGAARPGLPGGVGGRRAVHGLPRPSLRRGR